jgi:hypothetical protein
LLDSEHGLSVFDQRCTFGGKVVTLNRNVDSNRQPDAPVLDAGVFAVRGTPAQHPVESRRSGQRRERCHGLGGPSIPY